MPNNLILSSIESESFIVYADASSDESSESRSKNLVLSLLRSYKPPDSFIQRGNFCILAPIPFKWLMNDLYLLGSYQSNPFSSQYAIHTSIVFWKKALLRSSSSVNVVFRNYESIFFY